MIEPDRCSDGIEPLTGSPGQEKKLGWTIRRAGQLTPAPDAPWVDPRPDEITRLPKM